MGHEKLTGYYHTSSLKIFHSLLLKYCPKRQHFSYVGMQARIELAIIDHNYSTQCKQATTKAGKNHLCINIICNSALYLKGKARYLVSCMYLVDTLYVVVFPKGRKSWVAKPILEKKFDHLYHIMEDVAQL